MLTNLSNFADQLRFRLSAGRRNKGNRKLSQFFPTPNCISFENPVVGVDFPDPSSPVNGHDGFFYMFGTNGGTPAKNVQVARAPITSLGTWTYLNYDAMPTLPSWSTEFGGYVWAPEVVFQNGLYIMYVTMRYVASGNQAIGIATSPVAAGPYTPIDNGYPLVTQSGVLGSIDPYPFVDVSGARYLYYRGPGADGITPNIYVQGLSDDGLSVTGAIANVLQPSQAWETNGEVIPVVEGPAVTQCYTNTAYCLFYSGSSTHYDKYATGYAVGPTPFGPFVKYPANPILQTLGPVISPGGPSFLIPGDGRIYMMYHSWTTYGYQARGVSMVLLNLNPGVIFENVFVSPPCTLAPATWGVPTCQ